MLASHQLGMPKHICEWYTNILKNAQYHIQLPTCTSEQSYSSTDYQSLHFSGRGSQSAPSIWVYLSSIIMHCMKDKSRGIQFNDPYNTVQFHQIMTGFVDDTTHWTNNFPAALQGLYSQQAMYQDAQITAQWWEQLLYSTGGKLELEKCFYYPIMWHFDEEGIPSLQDFDEDQPITIISSENQEQVIINKKSPTSSHKTLGIMENPAGDYADEYQQLISLADKWKNSISHQFLTRQECNLFYQNFFIPSMRYHLTVGTFTEQQLDRIQHPITQLILPRLGFNGNMPKAVIYGPIQSGGMGFTSLSVIQAQQKIKHVLKAYHLKTPLWNLMHITFKWAQLVAGVSTDIFRDTSIELPALHKELWITTLRCFLRESSLALCLPGIELPPLQRINDEYIMDIIISTLSLIHI